MARQPFESADTESDFAFVDLGVAGLAPIPPGSLTLIAHHAPSLRDALFDEILCTLAFARHGVLVVCLSESYKVARARFEHALDKASREWACGEATEAVQDRTDDESVDERAVKKDVAARKRHEAESYKAIIQERLQDGVTFITSAVENMSDIRELARANDAVTFRVPTILVVDDLSAIRGERGKSGSSKNCGDHARSLKELAADHELLVIAGMPAPYLTTKDKDHWSHERRDVETTIKPSDLVAYGSPHEAADTILSCKPYRLSFGEYEYVAIQTRYGRTKR